MTLVDPSRAVDLLRAGELVALPTETVYGLAGRYDLDHSLEAIFTTKQRPFFDPLIVHVASIAEARALAGEWLPIHEELANRFWPGPLTLVVPKAAHVSSLITSGLDTVGIRCPRHPLTLDVLRRTGPLAAPSANRFGRTGPLAAPSANRFGRTSPTCAADVELEFGGRVATLDGGDCAVGVESTVVTVTGTHVDVLRPGGVSADDLRAELGDRFTVGRRHSVRSPGHLEVHYQPANPLILVDPDVTDAEVAAHADSRAIFWLDLPAEPEQAARRLYAEFRRLSAEAGLILVRRTTTLESSAWEAVFDRIRRAANTSWTRPTTTSSE